MKYRSEMKYCRICDDEYLAEISNCGVCGALLLTGDEMLASMKEHEKQLSSRDGALTPDDDIATVFKGPLADVKRIQGKFEKENIGTLIIGQDAGCGKSCCAPEFELKIRRQDGKAALRIIDSDFDQMTGYADFAHEFTDTAFDPESQENTCPACGFTFPTTSYTCPDCGLCFG